MKTGIHTIENYIAEICPADFPLDETTIIKYQAIKEHLCCELNGESVILSLKNGKYYGLNAVASRIWELIQKPLSIDEIQNAVQIEYDVTSEVCEKEVSLFLKQMADEKLIEIFHEKGSELL